MFCPNCGTKVLDSERFCHECGYLLKVDSGKGGTEGAVDVGQVDAAPPAPTVATTPPTPSAPEGAGGVSAAGPGPDVFQGAPAATEEWSTGPQATPQPTVTVPQPTAPQVATPQPSAPQATVMQPTPQPTAPLPTAARPAMAQPTTPQPTVPQPAVPQPTMPKQTAVSPTPPSGGGAPTPPPDAATGQAAPEPSRVPDAAPKQWYETPAARIVTLVAGIVMIVVGIMRIAGVFNKPQEPPAPIAQVPSPPASTLTDDGSTSATSTTEPTASSTDSTASTTDPTGSTTEPNVSTSEPTDSTTQPLTGAKDYAKGRDLSFLDDTELTDAHGNPSFYAVLELEGWQLNTLAQENGFIWSERETENAWVSADGSMVWGFIGGDGFLLDDEIAELDKGATGSLVLYIGLVSGYGSEMEVYQGMSNCVDSSSAVGPLGDYVFVVYGPSMKEYLLTIADAEDGDYEVTIYNPELIAAGAFDGMKELPKGVDSYGSTVREVFETYTGKSYGDHIQV